MQHSTRQQNSIVLPYHKDGLKDILVGIGIIFAGLSVWAEMAWMAGIFIPIFLPSFQTARKRIIYRRLGVSPDDPRLKDREKTQLLYVTVILGLVALAGILMFYAFEMLPGQAKQLLHENFLLVLGCLFACVWIMAAVLLRIPRFYLYAFSTLGLLTVSQFTGLDFPLALVLLGSLIFVVGMVLYLQFLGENPLPEGGS